MASNSGFTRNLPSGQSKVSNTDEEFRSLKSFMETWIETEHYAMGGSATSAGIHRHGSGRAFVGPASQLSNPTADNDGRLFWVTDTETLYVGQVSSSSWSAIADAIKLDSVQTWSARQAFNAGASLTQPTSLSGTFSGITSLTTVLVTDVGVGTDASTVSVLVNTNSRFTYGDVLLVSASSVIGGLADYTLKALIGSDPAFVSVQLRNFATSGSRTTLPSGTTLHIIGFKTAGIVI